MPAGVGSPSFVAALPPNGSRWTAISNSPQLVVGESAVAATRAPLTSLSFVYGAFGRASGSILVAATDTNGNIELFDQRARLLETFTPPDGPASSIAVGQTNYPIDLFYYVCSTCPQGLHEFLY